MEELLGEVLNYMVGVIKVCQGAHGLIHPSDLPAPYGVEGKVRRALAAKEFDDGKYKRLFHEAEKALAFMERVEAKNWEDGGAEALPEVDQFRQVIRGRKEDE